MPVPPQPAAAPPQQQQQQRDDIGPLLSAPPGPPPALCRPPLGEQLEQQRARLFRERAYVEIKKELERNLENSILQLEDLKQLLLGTFPPVVLDMKVRDALCGGVVEKLGGPASLKRTAAARDRAESRGGDEDRPGALEDHSSHAMETADPEVDDGDAGREKKVDAVRVQETKREQITLEEQDVDMAVEESVACEGAFPGRKPPTRTGATAGRDEEVMISAVAAGNTVGAPPLVEDGRSLPPPQHASPGAAAEIHELQADGFRFRADASASKGSVSASPSVANGSSSVLPTANPMSSRDHVNPYACAAASSAIFSRPRAGTGGGSSSSSSSSSFVPSTGGVVAAAGQASTTSASTLFSNPFRAQSAGSTTSTAAPACPLPLAGAPHDRRAKTPSNVQLLPGSAGGSLSSSGLGERDATAPAATKVRTTAQPTAIATPASTSWANVNTSVPSLARPAMAPTNIRPMTQQPPEFQKLSHRDQQKMIYQTVQQLAKGLTPAATTWRGAAFSGIIANHVAGSGGGGKSGIGTPRSVSANVGPFAAGAGSRTTTTGTNPRNPAQPQRERAGAVSAQPLAKPPKAPTLGSSSSRSGLFAFKSFATVPVVAAPSKKSDADNPANPKGS